jgi:heptosyltransferase III
MHTKRQDSVLIFRLGSIGDTVVALPCFHEIARTFSNYRRVLLTSTLTSKRVSSAESVLDGTGLIDDVIYYPVGDFSVKQVMVLMRKLRRLRPVTLIYLAERLTAASVYRDLAFFKAAGLRKIVGAPWKASLRVCMIDPKTLELEYEAQRLARTLQKVVSVSLSPSNWDLRLSASELAKTDALLGTLGASHQLLAIAPGAKIAAKDWGLDNWASLLKCLASTYTDRALIMVGAADDRAPCDELAQHWARPILNLCGILTPRETAAALRRSKLLVCHDSGPMHLAASQQTRCVALFGNYNQPRQWYPFGDAHIVIYEPRGVREIGVQRVASEIYRALNSRADPRVLDKALG